MAQKGKDRPVLRLSRSQCAACAVSSMETGPPRNTALKLQGLALSGKMLELLQRNGTAVSTGIGPSVRPAQSPTGRPQVTAEQRQERTGSPTQTRRNPYTDAGGPHGHSCHGNSGSAVFLPKAHVSLRDQHTDHRPQKRAGLAFCLFTARLRLLSSIVCEFYKFILNFEKTEVSEKYENNNPYHYEQLRNISF